VEVSTNARITARRKDAHMTNVAAAFLRFEFFMQILTTSHGIFLSSFSV
jgi:hypothetical protein